MQEPSALALETPDGPHAAINDLIQLLRPHAEAKGLSLRASVDPALEYRVRGDPHHLRQVLLNLVSNALKFTHQGGVTIAGKRNAREKMMVLSVADTGIGIAPADQDRIFEDFRQLDNSPTRAYGGTGLGLSICRRLAQMLDGRISVQSQVGKGSTFTLTLPTKGRK